MKKICVVVSSRASYARVKSVLRAIQKSKDLELFLIGSASLLLYKYGNAGENQIGIGNCYQSPR